MKRFLLFAGAAYYPSPGWHDFVDSFDNLASAKEAADKPNRSWDWRHVVDLQTGTIVYECEMTASGEMGYSAEL